MSTNPEIPAAVFVAPPAREEECEHEWTTEYAVQFCWVCGTPRARTK